MITPNFIDAIKVQFVNPIFEEDFPEKGMKAWLTDVEWCSKEKCYKLHFDFSDFEAENDKYFKASYYGNWVTEKLAEETGRLLFTAKETGNYTPKYSVYFNLTNERGELVSSRNDTLFIEEIVEYLREVE